MSDFLIIYSSTDGHTKTICEQMINLLDDGSLVKLVSLDEATKFNLIELTALTTVTLMTILNMVIRIETKFEEAFVMLPSI